MTKTTTLSVVVGLSYGTLNATTSKRSRANIAQHLKERLVRDLAACLLEHATIEVHDDLIGNAKLLRATVEVVDKEGT